MIDWNAYRADYDSMTYAEQVEFYDRVWSLHPAQKHFDAAACARFFAAPDAPARPHVLEVGGWRGELAAEMLGQFPEIVSWQNMEICRGAVEASACWDARYAGIQPVDWVWKVPLSGQTLVMSHTIEHMKLDQFKAILTRVRPDAVFLASPLTDRGQDWAGYDGSHVLTAGWNEVIKLVETFHLIRRPELDAPDVRCFL